MDPKATIKKNIKRRTLIVDEKVEIHGGVPMPTWVELSLIDVCNRSCSFCPKSDPSVAPDTYQMMSRKLIDKVHDDLKVMNYKGAIALCGYGEPLLHKDISYIVKKLSNVAPVEIITNGDVLTSKTLQDLYLAKTSRVLISMYDGPEQIEKFETLTKKANVPQDFVILRDRWYDADKDYGVKLTNRAGTIKTGIQPSLEKYSKCFYPTYQFLIDWNGDIFLCPQDWQRRVTMGNMMQETIMNIWKGKILTKFRKNLLKGKRNCAPCNSCNAEGTVLGYNHAKAWETIYK
ncbi:MAG: radical SAM/SPASM domain-containing protein [Pelagibacteraceae bacterium]